MSTLKTIWMTCFYKTTILSVAIFALMQGCREPAEITYIFENATDHVITITGYSSGGYGGSVKYANLPKKGDTWTITLVNDGYYYYAFQLESDSLVIMYDNDKVQYYLDQDRYDDRERNPFYRVPPSGDSDWERRKRSAYVFEDLGYSIYGSSSYSSRMRYIFTEQDYRDAKPL